LDEVKRLGALEGSEINEAKRVLAYEVTKLIHGEAEEEAAKAAAEALFGDAGMGGSVPTTEITAEELAAESRLIALIAKCGMCKSNGEARKAVQQGGVTIGDEKVSDPDFRVTKEMLEGDGIVVRKGKKTYHRFCLKV
jgi:tyrosyl-tRNA synthetase